MLNLKKHNQAVYFCLVSTPKIKGCLKKIVFTILKQPFKRGPDKKKRTHISGAHSEDAEGEHAGDPPFKGDVPWVF